MAIKFKNELMVGIFVMVGIAIFIIFVFSIADVRLFAKMQDIKIVFGFANGVKASSPVRLAGVDIGQVKGLKVRFNERSQKNEVVILAKVKADTVIPRDSKVWINTLGLLGEKYIEIIPGIDYSNLLKPGEMIRGKDPVPMQEITEMGKEIALKLKESIEGINELILTEQNTGAFSQVLENLEEASSSLKEIMEKINSGDGTAGKLLTDEAIYTDTKELIADVKKNPWKLLRKPDKAN